MTAKTNHNILFLKDKIENAHFALTFKTI